MRSPIVQALEISAILPKNQIDFEWVEGASKTSISRVSRHRCYLVSAQKVTHIILL